MLAPKLREDAWTKFIEVQRFLSQSGIFSRICAMYEGSHVWQAGNSALVSPVPHRTSFPYHHGGEGNSQFTSIAGYIVGDGAGSLVAAAGSSSETSQV